MMESPNKNKPIKVREIALSLIALSRQPGIMWAMMSAVVERRLDKFILTPLTRRFLHLFNCKSTSTHGCHHAHVARPPAS